MANNNSINRANKVNTSNIQFEGPQANNYGGKFAKVRYEGGWLLVQTPKMVVPFGANVFTEEDKDGKAIRKSYSIDLSFNGFDESGKTGEFKPKVKQMFDLVDRMETALVDTASQNSFTWIGDSTATPAVCKALLRTSVKYSRDKSTQQIIEKYAPRLKVNLPVYDDGMGFKAYLDGRDTEITNIEELVGLMSGRCEVVAILRCDKVTFNGGKYGFKWNVQQLKLFTSSSSLSNYAFIDDSDDEDGAKVVDGESKEESTDVVVNTSEQETNVDDSPDELDNSEDSSDEEEETVESPPPSPKKKPRKKKGS